MRAAIAITVLLLSTVATTLVGCSHKHLGVITIDGSDTVYPLSEAMVEAFHQTDMERPVKRRLIPSLFMSSRV